MLSRTFVRLSAAALSALAFTAAAAARPNIVLIVADDMGYADLEPHGSTEIRTPRLARLAADGVTCTSGYVTHSFCGPSRAGFITGRHQQRFGHETNPDFDQHNDALGLRTDQATIARRLQDAGYRTGGVGKWHLGAASPFYPLNRGFDTFYGFLGGGHDYFTVDVSTPLGSGYKHGLVRDRQPASFEGYLTDALSDEAAQFITRSAAQADPFFLYVAYNAPHSPMQAPEADIQLHKHIQDPKRRTYAGMVHALDRGIGTIVDAIDQAGATDNTLLIFFSDNGGPQKVTWSKWFDNGSSNLPLRSGKSSVYEGGNRVPFLMAWPGTLPAGLRYDRPVSVLDAVRTAVEAGGAEAGALAGADDTMHGVDLLPHLTGQDANDPHEALFWREWGGRRWAVRSGDLKLVSDKARDGRTIELYDLAADIGETTNLAAQRPDDVARLRGLYDAWNAENIPPAFPNASDYQKLRKKFYENVPAP